MTKPYQLIHLKTVDSTNRYLKDYALTHNPVMPVFCKTDQQTQGYGQQNRSWTSNDDSALFSLIYPVPLNTLIEGILSLKVAALLHQCLQELTQATLYLKWPNDLFNKEGKVSGILIEQVKTEDYRALIIGIGINRGNGKLMHGVSSVPDFDIDQLIGRLFEHIKPPGLVNFCKPSLLTYWKQYDFFSLNEAVQLISNNTQESGTYLGINLHGQACIQQDKTIQTISSGQTSIRKQQNFSQ